MPPPAQLNASHTAALRRQAGITGGASRRHANTATGAPPSGAHLSSSAHHHHHNRPIEFKVVVLGESSVGKSSLIRQFVHRSFDQRLLATVGCDFSNKTFTVDVPVVHYSSDGGMLLRQQSSSSQHGGASRTPDVNGSSESPHGPSPPQPPPSAVLAGTAPAVSHSAPVPATTSAAQLMAGADDDASPRAGSGASSTAGSGGGGQSAQPQRSPGTTTTITTTTTTGAAGLPRPRRRVSVLRSSVNKAGPRVPVVAVDGGEAVLGPETRIALVSLQVWDTAGGERHNTLGALFFRGADACVLVCDVTNAKSFGYLEHWADEFQKHVGPDSEAVIMVVANKTDHPPEKHIITDFMISEFCRRRGFYRVAPDMSTSGIYAPEPTSFGRPSPEPTPRGNTTAPTGEADTSCLQQSGSSRSPSMTAGVVDSPESSPGRRSGSASDAVHAQRATEAVSASDRARDTASPSASMTATPPLANDSTTSFATVSEEKIPFGMRSTATTHASAEAVFASLAIELVARRDIAQASARRSRASSVAGGAGAAAADDGADAPDVPTRTVKLTARPGNAADGAQADPKKKKRCKC